MFRFLLGITKHFNLFFSYYDEDDKKILYNNAKKMLNKNFITSPEELKKYIKDEQIINKIIAEKNFQLEQITNKIMYFDIKL